MSHFRRPPFLEDYEKTIGLHLFWRRISWSFSFFRTCYRVIRRQFSLSESSSGHTSPVRGCHMYCDTQLAVTNRRRSGDCLLRTFPTANELITSNARVIRNVIFSCPRIVWFSKPNIVSMRLFTLSTADRRL